MLRLRGFVPYLVVGVLHLGVLAFDLEQWAVPTKYALMPALALGIVLSRPRGAAIDQRVVGFAFAGVALSWAGDILISTPDSFGFLAGLACFMLAHLAYLLLFLSGLGVRRVPRVTVGYVVWFFALLAVLAPSLGALLAPVAVYGLVLGAGAAIAAGASRVTAVGGLLFLISDTILALKFFLPGFSLWQSDLFIMSLYISGQLLIVAGALAHSARQSRPILDERRLI